MPSDVPTGCTKVYEIIKSLPRDTQLCFLKYIKIDCVFCSVSYTYSFVDDKISVDCFKDDIIPSLKANYKHKFSQDVEMNHVRYKGRPQ